MYISSYTGNREGTPIDMPVNCSRFERIGEARKKDIITRIFQLTLELK